MIQYPGMAYDAMVFARHAHRNQVRKYTGNPYADHLAEVAGIVATVTDDPVAISVAWLHDCVEDVGVSRSEIDRLFGASVCAGVFWLSDMEVGNRAERKALSRERLGDAVGWIQTIKCADLIGNTSSIVKHDPAFAKVYLEEKRLLLKVLLKADPRLRAMAESML